MRPSLHHADVIIGSLPLPSLDGRRGRAVALALGLVSATGFQPLNLWPLTLAVIALFMMLAHAAQSRWGALALGWWFGLGHFTLGLNRSEEHTSELQSLLRIPSAVFCLKKKKTKNTAHTHEHYQET